MDVSKEKEGSIKEGFVEILNILKTQKAESMSKFLKRYGDMLGYYGSKKFLEQDMSVINESDIITPPKLKL